MKIFKIVRISQNIQNNNYFDLEETVDECSSLDEVKMKLVENNIVFKDLNLKENRLIVVDIVERGKPRKYVIDDSINMREATRWIWDIDEDYLTDYVGNDEDSNQTFWDGVGNGTVTYHATRSENIQNIQRVGLLAKNESRGISNRGMGDAVFTSYEPEEITDSYGGNLIEINLGKMKADGYMPEVSMEEPIIFCDLRNAIAHAIGLEDFYCETDSSDGLSPNTVAIYGNIPPKYLKFV